MATAQKQSAAEARKAHKTERADLTVKILPNISFDEKGDWANLKYVLTRVVPNAGDPFNVHDVVFQEGGLDVCYIGKDKTKTPLTPGMEVSLKGNARLDRGFAKMTPGASVIVEYLGKVEIGGGRSANDYLFDLIK